MQRPLSNSLLLPSPPTPQFSPNGSLRNLLADSPKHARRIEVVPNGCDVAGYDWGNVNRRQFLSLAAYSAALRAGSPKMRSRDSKAYGSGHFGAWITDEHGLPAYRYTCDQTRDPKAHSPVHTRWRSSTDHTHQVGNDRLVAAVSNYGYLQVRQDEGSPKFLNDYCPDRGLYGAGLGFLTDGTHVLSTFYHGGAEQFERIMGEGYFRKTVRANDYEVDQVLFAPFGDDPVLISEVHITHHGPSPARLRWVEYWGCQNYQFSYRSGMQAAMGGGKVNSTELRRQFASRFAHQFTALPMGRGLAESQHFLGRTAEDEQSWDKVKAFLKANPSGFYGGALPDPAPGTAMED